MGRLAKQRARLILDPECDLWRASEVPKLTAAAMYPLGAKPQQRRTLVIVEHEGQLSPYAELTDEHWGLLRKLWGKAGLEAPARASKKWYQSIGDFEPYLIAANHQSGTRTWLLGVTQEDAASVYEHREFAQYVLQQEHEKALVQQLRNGEIKAHRVSGPEAGGDEALQQLVLRRDQVKSFAESLNIVVEEPSQLERKVKSLADDSLTSGPTLSSEELCNAFSAIKGLDYQYWRRQIDKNLPAWLVACRASKGKQGGSPAEARWYPLKVAEALASGGIGRKTVSADEVEKAFNDPLLRGRKPDWTALRQNHSEWG